MSERRIRRFVETRAFKRRIDDLLDEPAQRDLQNLLIEQPERGSLIQGSGGARKLRFADVSRGKGKRGGIRVIYYLHHDLALMLIAYGKDKQDDISPSEAKAIRQAIKLSLGKD